MESILVFFAIIITFFVGYCLGVQAGRTEYEWEVEKRKRDMEMKQSRKISQALKRY